MYSRREWLRATVAGGVALVLPTVLNGETIVPMMTIYRSPSCGCCEDWSNYLRAHGFAVRVVNVNDIDTIKTRYRVPDSLLSCHTATVDRYVVEGHVPADLIHRLLREKPAAAGIGVAGMPAGSPGMELTGEHAGHRERYTVFMFDRAGRTTFYAHR